MVYELVLLPHSPERLTILLVIECFNPSDISGNTANPINNQAEHLQFNDGFLNRERYVPFLMLASPPLIRDQNQMR